MDSAKPDGRVNLFYSLFILTQTITSHFLFEFRKVALIPSMQMISVSSPAILKDLSLGATYLHFLKQMPLKPLLLLSINFTALFNYSWNEKSSFLACAFNSLFLSPFLF